LTFTATTEGSFKMMPRPRTYTRVFAVPRSIAMSRPSRKTGCPHMGVAFTSGSARMRSPKIGVASRGTGVTVRLPAPTDLETE
jgi:hypothetical protein